MAQYDPIRNRPVRIRWAGWETDTYRLQDAGWRLSAAQNPYLGCMQLAIDHPGCHVQGLTDIVEDVRRLTLGAEPTYQAKLRYVGGPLRVYPDRLLDSVWGAIDCTPTYDPTPPNSLSDLCHFAPSGLVRSKSIIMPDERSVEELLAAILRKQEGAKMAYYREEVARDTPREEVFHAQIITLGQKSRAA